MWGPLSDTTCCGKSSLFVSSERAAQGSTHSHIAHVQSVSGCGLMGMCGVWSHPGHVQSVVSSWESGCGLVGVVSCAECGWVCIAAALFCTMSDLPTYAWFDRAWARGMCSQSPWSLSPSRMLNILTSFSSPARYDTYNNTRQEFSHILHRSDSHSQSDSNSVAFPFHRCS